jgi:ubiquinone/menaquinone biosynthesis C-methylase UbiE
MTDPTVRPTDDAGAAYAGLARAWSGGPSRVYDRLAEVVVGAYPDAIAGQSVLDIGAGTGAVSRAVRFLGGQVTAVDAADDMVEHMRAHGLEAVTGDLLSLPFDSPAFDGAIAAFSISHVADPVRALAEARRVVRDGGCVVVGLFAATRANASKDVVDAVAQRYGYARPAWYDRLKREYEPLTNTPSTLRECARSADLVDITIAARVVDTGVTAPADIVASRIGMAHLAPFVAALDDATRQAFVAEAIATVALDPQPLRPEVLLMTSRVRR